MKEDSSRKVQAEKELTEEQSIFPSKVPWINSTPQSRLPPAKEDDLPLPPPPHLPQPPATPLVNAGGQALSEEEAKLLSHLQGIRQYGKLPEVLLTQLEALEQRQQESLNNRALTHSHLNKLNKVRHQTSVLGDKIKSVDEEWLKFVAESTSRLQQHATMYHAHRNDLVTQYNAKVQELTALRQEVSNASQSLVNQTPQPEVPAEAMDTVANIEVFNQAAVNLGVGEAMLVEESDPELLEEGQPSTKVLSGTKPHLQPRAFREAGSPNRVAHLHVKGKQHQQNRDKDRGLKGHKDAKETSEQKEVKEEM